MSLIHNSEINKLICFQQCLEKSISTTIEHLKKISNYEDIPETFLTQKRERQAERNALHSDNKKLVDNIKLKINFLKQNNSLNSTNLNQFKNEMITIQDSIQTLRQNSKIRLRELNIECEDINQDVDYYKEKMLEWSYPVNIKDSSMRANYKRPYTGLKCVEMREFIDFVRRSGGHENGWDREDHQLFLKLRNKFKEVKIVAQKVNESLPDKTIEDVKEHEEWYKTYLILKRNKKEALKRWQETKSQKNKLSPSTLILEDTFKKPMVTHSQEDLKEKLVKWKLEKEMKMKNSQLAEELKEQKKNELENYKKRRNDEIKKVVEEWKTTKISIEKEHILRRKIQEDHENKRKATEANKLIKQFQTQDDYYIFKMRKNKKRLETLKPIRSKSSQVAKRDPDRVLKPTMQWINRVHDDNIYPFDAVIPLKKLPKLRIPEWRKKTVE